MLRVREDVQRNRRCQPPVSRGHAVVRMSSHLDRHERQRGRFSSGQRSGSSGMVKASETTCYGGAATIWDW